MFAANCEQCCAVPSEQCCQQGCLAMKTMLLQHCSSIKYCYNLLARSSNNDNNNEQACSINIVFSCSNNSEQPLLLHQCWTMLKQHCSLINNIFQQCSRVVIALLNQQCSQLVLFLAACTVVHPRWLNKGYDEYCTCSYMQNPYCYVYNNCMKILYDRKKIFFDKMVFWRSSHISNQREH